MKYTHRLSYSVYTQYFLDFFSPSNFICPRIVFAVLHYCHAWNIAPKQSRVTTNAAPEVSKLTAEMIADSDEGSDTNPSADLDEVKDQTEEN